MIFGDCFDFSNNLSLYIHIPFCTKKCSYCAFYSRTNCTEAVKSKYVDRLVKEIDELSEKLGKPYYTAFIGGGNPLILKPQQLEKIAKAVCKYGRPIEFTTEMNPESLDESYFYLFEKYFTRLSMGVQSLNQKALAFLGRNSSLDQTLKGMALSQKIKQSFGCQINYDLITCLGPWHDSKDDIKRIVELYQTDHLSLYALTLEPGTLLFRNKVKLPDSEQQADELSELWDYLESNGYTQYEVSNFCVNDMLSLHNSVYWAYQQYAGLGSCASSTGFKNDFAYRIEASSLVDGYDYRITKLTKTEELEEFVIMGLRHCRGLDLCRLKNDFGFELKSVPAGYRIMNNFLVPDKTGLLTADAAAMTILSDIVD